MHISGSVEQHQSHVFAFAQQAIKKHLCCYNNTSWCQADFCQSLAELAGIAHMIAFTLTTIELSAALGNRFGHEQSLLTYLRYYETGLMTLLG